MNTNKRNKNSESNRGDNTNGFYTIFAPATVQRDYDYTVTLAIHHRTEPAIIKLDLNSLNYRESKTVEVHPYRAEIVSFRIPSHITMEFFGLRTEGVKGLIFRDYTELNFKNVKPQIYIQTDKSIYKPGDMVQYRILALDENTGPAKLEQSLHLAINDGEDNQIIEVKDIQFSRGIHKGYLQLSEQPVLGDWKIVITQDGDTGSKASKSFEVVKYISPKLDVEIDVLKEVAVKDNDLHVIVRSKDTHGKPVKGRAYITAEVNDRSSRKFLDIMGKGEVKFNLKKDLGIEYKYNWDFPKIKLSAVMTEAVTGMQYRSPTATVNVLQSRYIIEIPNLRREYEINKPFEIKVIIKRFDGKPIISKSKAKFSFSSVPGGINYKQKDIDKNGLATFNFNLSKEGRLCNMKMEYEEAVFEVYDGFAIVSAPTKDPLLPRNDPSDYIGPIKIFVEPEDTNPDGTANFTTKIPDSITSWVITGFSLNEKTGFGITKDPKKIRVFKSFFVSLNLPYSIKLGEVIKLPVNVCNNMEQNLNAVITLDNEDDEFDCIEPDIIEGRSKYQITKNLIINSNASGTTIFCIKPKIIGEIAIKIKAITPLAGDAVHQRLKVEAEGVKHYKNESLLISVTAKESGKYTLKANIPKEVVMDSEYLEFSVVKDFIGLNINKLGNVINLPRGCGEQNMIDFVCNTLILEYLDALKRDMPDIKKKALNFLEIGYQRQLAYKHKDGGYSAFGESDDHSNSWLTAYVLRSFLQARNFITIDKKIIDAAFKYLIDTQMTNGKFPTSGNLYQSPCQNEFGISAFILLAFLEDKKYATKYNIQIEKSLQYLNENVDKEDDTYALAIGLLVFCKVKHPKAEIVLQRLETRAKFENNQKWWSSSSNDFHNEVEITAYICQSLMEADKSFNNILPIIKWIMGKRSYHGGFESSQATAVGLKALYEYAQKYGDATDEGPITIQYEAQTDEGIETTKGTILVSQEESLLTQSHVLPKTTRQISLTAEGKGLTLVQLSYSYSLTTPGMVPSFIVKHKAKKPLYPGHLFMNISVEFKPQNQEIKKSNMTIMEISLPSGYSTNYDILQCIRDSQEVRRVETKNEATLIVVYFQSLLNGEPVNFDVSAERTHEVCNRKLSPITIYDYYNTYQRSTIYYEVKQKDDKFRCKINCCYSCGN
ncbi:CD109 antigen-like isoform X2 [Haematobia irritans]|uniref:CD109 antigen-like isoform X2 n=1 Tax=Haematobia irritans TaxID=7368 RepID=UPI003F4F5479